MGKYLSIDETAFSKGELYTIITNKKAFNLVQELRNIFNTATSIQTAYTKLAHWYKDVEQTGFRAFNTIANTITLNYRSILNYFINRSTNASAESFNAKIKAFRSQFRGVKNTEFFLFRLTQILHKHNNLA